MKIKLGIPLGLNEIAAAISAEAHKPDTRINYICTDSREVTCDTLFFALNDRAEVFVDEVLRVAHAVSVNGRGLAVKNTEDALLSLCSYYITLLKRLKAKVMITGSVGKTTVKELTAAILSTKYKVTKTKGNFNNAIGLPLSVLEADADTEILVLEAGMNSLGEIKRLSQTVKPTVAVITNVGTAHVGMLGSRENIAKAKLEILSGLEVGGRVIIPEDEPLLKGISDRLTVGDSGAASIKIRSIHNNECTFDMSLLGQKIEGIALPLCGEHFATDAAFAALAAYCVGLSIKEISGAFLNKIEFKARQKYIDLGKFKVYDDSYNASLESYTAVFKMLTASFGDTAAVIGDVLEAGAEAEYIHREIGSRAARFGIGMLYPFGKHANAVRDGALNAGMLPEDILVNTDPDAPEITARQIIEHTKSGTTLLVKGSRAIKTERIITCIKQALGDKND